MNIDKRQVQRNFDHSAITYDQYAMIQKEIATELMVNIKSTGRRFKNILEVGCGTGFLTELLAREYPQAHILALDIAPEMIKVAQAKLGHFHQITYLAADGENLQLGETGHFDLIVSNLVFQWFAAYGQPFARYSQALQTGGDFLFSTLGEGTFLELYACLAQLTWPEVDRQPLCNPAPFISKEHLKAVMEQVGFQEIKVIEYTKQEYFPSSRAFLHALKKTGAHSYLTGRLGSKGVGPGIFKVINQYDSRFQTNNGVPATYHCLFGSGRKGEETAKSSQEVT